MPCPACGLEQAILSTPDGIGRAKERLELSDTSRFVVASFVKGIALGAALKERAFDSLCPKHLHAAEAADADVRVL